jgi:MoaA/NifB/PqqE/SkfB family radical SAM enzyme
VHRPDDPEDTEAARISLVHNKVKRIVELLLDEGHKVQLSITGSGDPFASPLYWGYLKELASKELPSRLSIILQTNGVMMTEKYWLEIQPLWKHIVCLNISVDAATEETYKIVRKNGNFTRLKLNLEYLDKMIQDNHLPNLRDWQSNFIVQRDNFRELKEFVKWQLSYRSLTKIWTNLISQWHHMSDEEYNAMAIWKDENPMRDELIEILKDPIFNNPRIKLGNMSSLVPKG